MDIFKLLLNIVVLNYVRNKESLTQFLKVGFRLGYVIILVAIVSGNELGTIDSFHR